MVLHSRLAWLLSYPSIGGALEHRPTWRCSRVTSLMCLLPPHYTLFLHFCQCKFEVHAGTLTCLRQWMICPIKFSSPVMIINCIRRYFTKVKMRYWTACTRSACCCSGGCPLSPSWLGCPPPLHLLQAMRKEWALILGGWPPLAFLTDPLTEYRRPTKIGRASWSPILCNYL